MPFLITEYNSDLSNKIKVVRFYLYIRERLNLPEHF